MKIAYKKLYEDQKAISGWAVTIAVLFALLHIVRFFL